MTETLPPTLIEGAVAVLATPEARDKARLSGRLAAAWRDGTLAEIGSADPPDRPARPTRPELCPPRDMPRRRANTEAGRAALLHAIAHIELNAIDLAWDMVARFGTDGLPRAFVDDWVGVAADEARHFTMLDDCLAARGAPYGSHPAHDGLWEAAERTADDVLARLAVVPLVLEARGLDTTPAAVARLRKAGDAEAADILAVIEEEEVGHVAAGARWFHHVCARRGLAPAAEFHRLVRARFRGRLKPPFADAARAQAGLPEAFYKPLSE